MLLPLLTRLCAIPGVSGDEAPVREAIRELVAPHADELKVDALGNLYVFQKGRAPSNARPHMLCAHMDEVGLIVKSITSEGALRFGVVGGLDRRVLLGRRVRVGPKGLLGVIGLKANHLLGKSEKNEIPPLRDLRIDIGARDAAEAETLVALGDTCVFDTEPAPFGDGCFKARALDDRLGCALLVSLLTGTRPKHDSWTVFTIQEEAGARGAGSATETVEPSFALVVESTTAADRPDMKPHEQVCRLGQGLVLPVFDPSTLYDPLGVRRMVSLCEARGIPWQTKEAYVGGTDAGAIHTRLQSVPTVALAAPVRYLHSPVSVGCVRDFENMLLLLKAFYEEACPDQREVLS